METPKLGQLIEGDAQRDAVHVAVYPAKAACFLRPGERVAHHKSDYGEFAPCTAPKASIGIVDPFLTEDVKPGQVFWLFLMPGTTNNLRHNWDHSAFPDDTETGWGYDGCSNC